jgi:hypothetical protein
VVSIIGRDARIIQADMCPQENRLKVRYSQLFDFSDCQQAQVDLFMGLFLSDPISRLDMFSEESESDLNSPAGDTASQLAIYRADTRRKEHLFSIPSAWMSTGTGVMVS